LSVKKVRPDQLLDSEESLRLADNLLVDLTSGSMLGSATDGEDGAMSLPEILLHAHREITGMLDGLRRSRAMIENAALERLRRTHEKLREVNSATELATTDILNSLDRALTLIDDLDPAAQGGARAAHDGSVCAQLRDEVHRVIGCLQFQDITAQQIGYASTVLQDLEERLDAIAEMLDRNLPTLGSAVTGVNKAGSSFDPAASTLDAQTRQALADEIFTGTAD
jgi:hypothetical protein